MLRRCVRSLGAVCLLVILNGCASKEPIQVTLEQSPAALSSGYGTYAWRSAPAEGDLRNPTEATRRDWFIRMRVDRLLAAKGYTKSSDAPSFLVDYEFVEKQKQTSSIQDFVGYRRAGGAEDLIDAFTIGYSEGLLVLGIFDASTNQLIWRTRATVLADQKDSDKRIADALRQMLARWPTRRSSPEP